ncbi:predicted protein [Nematostella vectensis]|uniref:G-protein coupled receptors family 1 profile domain-containing protein n=1 Tax=Nematostella vectensis TaxID=45351 RepID=A7SCA7_NEMVE|nr:predicted protein [Nematostella vectensis]|eukprot:XP_001630714.1 predicted protein [Nematostella vectensis]
MHESKGSPHNISSHDYRPSFGPSTDIPSILLAIAIVLLNTTVLHLVRARVTLRTVTNIFLASLATSDLLTGLYVIPAYLACKATANNGICQASVPLLTFTSFSTVTHISLVTAERHVAIMFALRHTVLVTKFRAKLVIVSVWVVSLILSLIQLAWTPPGDLDVTEEGTENFRKSEIAFSLFNFVTVLIQFPFLAYSYYKIFSEVRRHNEMIKKDQSHGCITPGNQHSHESRTVIMFVLMLVTYTFCWMPNALIRYQYSSTAFHLPEWAEHVIIHLRFVTSLVNPCFCLFWKRDFREAFSHGRRMRSDEFQVVDSPHLCSTRLTAGHYIELQVVP